MITKLNEKGLNSLQDAKKVLTPVGTVLHLDIFNQLKIEKK